MATFDKINISLAGAGAVSLLLGGVMSEPVAPILKVALAAANLWSWIW